METRPVRMLFRLTFYSRIFLFKDAIFIKGIPEIAVE